MTGETTTVIRKWAAPVALLIVSALYLSTLAFRHWIPHDEGTLSQAAWRLLDGELPHRDFEDPYTGGLAYLYAAAFSLLGPSLRSIRWVLLFAATSSILVVYLIARRVVGRVGAWIAAAAALAWSFPNYFAGLPSWYALILSLFATWVLLRWIENSRRRELFIAGVLVGLSFLAKVTTGMFTLAACLLFFSDWERLARTPPVSPVEPGLSLSRSWYRPFKIVLLGLFVTALALLPAIASTLSSAILFLLPLSTLAGVVALDELRDASAPAGGRFAGLFRMLGPFLGGSALPVGLFLIPYLAGDGLEDLYRGLFVLPRQRFVWATFPLPPADSLLLALPFGAILFWPLWRRIRHQTLLLVATLILLAPFVLFGAAIRPYRLLTASVRPLLSIAVLAGAVLLLESRSKVLSSPLRRGQLLLVLAMAGATTLVQYPYSFYVYFFYTTPFVILALLFVVAAQHAPPWRVHAAIALGLTVFATLWLNRGYVRVQGSRFIHAPGEARLEGPRGGLLVDARSAAIYNRLTARIAELNPPGSPIYAGPDCPELYTLTATRNPTRSTYEFMTLSPEAAAQTLSVLQREDLFVVVLNRRPEFSPPTGPELISRIESRFPHRESVGRFELRWRTAAAMGR